MDDDAFSTEQQEYHKGFMAGVEGRRGTQLPAGSGGAAADGAPPDLQRAAQDRTVAAGGKLTAEERAKRERNPLDRWDELVARAEADKFPHGVDNLLTRWHGLFFVGPTQNAFMCRLRMPGGILSTHQLRGIAEIAEELAGGYADVTTRANLQLREIPAHAGPEVLIRLEELGIVPRGSGADNVRNVTGSPTAGIDPQEILDTRPHARAIHHHILKSRDLFGLPRKFNIAFDGGGRVPVLEDTNDISFHAVQVPDGHGVAPGVYYRLGLGGITGHKDFARDTGVVVTPAETTLLCDAILRVFISHGDRTNRNKARLKYLLDSWGFDKFLAEVETVLGRTLTRIPADALPPRAPQEKHGHIGVHDQLQPGLHYIGVVLPVGRVTVERLRGLCDVADRFGSGTIRLTVWQNLLISDIPSEQVEPAKAAIAALGLGWAASHLRGGLIACTGNAGCKFAAANTKRHAAELADYLDAHLTVDSPVNIHLTGCHNSCAQHYVGDIGLIGAKVERGEDEVEGYDLHVGGGAGAEQAIARLVRPKVAADELYPLVLNLLRAWVAGRTPGETFQRFTARHDEAALDAMAGAKFAEAA